MERTPRALTSFGVLSLTLFAPAVLSGCEFGKNSSRTELIGYDTSSGYYRTNPQSLELTSTVSGSTTFRAGSIQSIPDELQEAISNPILVLVEDPVKGKGSIRNSSDTNIGYTVNIQQNAGQITRSESGYATSYSCRLNQDITFDGDYVKLSETIENGFKIRGSLSLDYEIVYTLTGDDADCAEWLTRMKNCYSDLNACETGENSIVKSGFVHAIFDPYIESGSFTANQISDVRYLKLRASYR